MSKNNLKKIDEPSSHSTELFHLIIENVKDYAIFMTDPHGIVVSWNPGVEALLGHAEAEITGQPSAVIFSSEDRAARVPETEMKTAAKNGRVRRRSKPHVPQQKQKISACGCRSVRR